MTISEYEHLQPLQQVLEDLAEQYSKRRGTIIHTDLAKMTHYDDESPHVNEVYVMRETDSSRIREKLHLRPLKQTLIIMEYLLDSNCIKAVVDTGKISEEEQSMLERCLAAFNSNHSQDIKLEKKKSLAGVKYEVEYQIHILGAV
jgi:hypothetical protein